MLPASQELETANIRPSVCQTFTSRVRTMCPDLLETRCKESFVPAFGEGLQSTDCANQEGSWRAVGGTMPPCPLLPCGNLFDLQSLLRRSRWEAGLFAWRRECR